MYLSNMPIGLLSTVRRALQLPAATSSTRHRKSTKCHVKCELTCRCTAALPRLLSSSFGPNWHTKCDKSAAVTARVHNERWHESCRIRSQSLRSTPGGCLCAARLLYETCEPGWKQLSGLHRVFLSVRRAQAPSRCVFRCTMSEHYVRGSKGLPRCGVPQSTAHLPACVQRTTVLPVIVHTAATLDVHYRSC